MRRGWGRSLHQNLALRSLRQLFLHELAHPAAVGRFAGEPCNAAFITLPMSFIEDAPVSWTASAIALRMSSSEAAAGRYSSMIVISASSFRAISSRPPFLNCSAESLRCLTSVFKTAIASAFFKRFHFVDFFILDRGLHHAQHTQSELLLAAHRIGHMRLNFLLKIHYFIP